MGLLEGPCKGSHWYISPAAHAFPLRMQHTNSCLCIKPTSYNIMGNMGLLEGSSSLPLAFTPKYPCHCITAVQRQYLEGKTSRHTSRFWPQFSGNVGLLKSFSNGSHQHIFPTALAFVVLLHHIKRFSSWVSDILLCPEHPTTAEDWCDIHIPLALPGCCLATMMLVDAKCACAMLN